MQFQHMLSARLNRKVARLNYSHSGAGCKVKVYHHHRTIVHGHKLGHKRLQSSQAHVQVASWSCSWAWQPLQLHTGKVQRKVAWKLFCSVDHFDHCLCNICIWLQTSGWKAVWGVSLVVWVWASLSGQSLQYVG